MSEFATPRNEFPPTHFVISLIVHSRLAIKLARLFPVNLRMIMPKVREEIRNRDGQLGSFMAVDRLHQKLRNLEMILKQQK